MDREACHTAFHGATNTGTQLSWTDWLSMDSDIFWKYILRVRAIQRHSSQASSIMKAILNKNVYVYFTLRPLDIYYDFRERQGLEEIQTSSFLNVLVKNKKITLYQYTEFVMRL